jgi:hypothetical protein
MYDSSAELRDLPGCFPAKSVRKKCDPGAWIYAGMTDIPGGDYGK